ncbi:hypothetical protein CCUG63695_03063 [Mycobacteroides franklinii]|uniref:Uncharacterized protein n=1 Tax=Mycobacteroides franklinii TaxID=948102 RepID=A0A4R8R768_9MYCO|nr:hypothetical protein CCUG64054_03136 [Mycobacteroides franklinii]TDZ50219.1 hypothetical protein CCUG63697_01721 [Mycobacteroides franklinii]TDZ56640.1 hypothetical protein CCUG63696_03138 [Mycobacteroides franklinii]TDZ63581.1 hypothetical protein CCUG63695_03063 [Mycobacteroides franklinii]TDZ69978.1 hypothetical protein CCUG64056_03136 [Mycobacteroides franklinii]
MSPLASQTLGVWLHAPTGCWNLEDLIGHDCYVVAASAFCTVSELGRAVLDSYEKEAKLWGLFVVVPEEVNVNVTTAVAVLERAEAELLALVASGPAAISAQPVIDAEVVEP